MDPFITGEFPSLPADAPAFDLTGRIAEGGQKTVFRVTNPDFGECVMKVIRSASTQAIERASRELDAALQLTSSRFPRTYWNGWVRYQGSLCFTIVEEYIRGTTLRALLETCGSLDLEYTSWLGHELLCALQEIHDLKIVHRDIKPENVMIADSSRGVVILDLGIARHLDLESVTDDLALVGPLTVGYAAPEQILNRKRVISARTDLFSWGVVMYECMTGVNPFVTGACGPSDVLDRTLRTHPAIPETGDSPLGAAVRLCMQKQPHLRPASAAEVARILRGG